MAKATKGKVTLAAIRKELKSAAEDFLRRVAKAHPNETTYGFLFEISTEGFSAHGALGTEEHLARGAAEVADGDEETTREMSIELRWRGIEDAWYQQPDKAFDAVNRLLRQAERDELYEAYDGTLEGICLDVLKQLDKAGTFGKGSARDTVVLGLCYIGGDNSDEEFLAWAKQVNPPGVIRRLRKELNGEVAPRKTVASSTRSGGNGVSGKKAGTAKKPSAAGKKAPAKRKRKQ